MSADLPVDTTEVIWSFLVASLLGFLIGLERERKRELRGSIFAGVRTFPLIALLGALSGQLSKTAGTAVIVIALGALSVLLALAYWRATGDERVGGTSEIAALVTFGLGVLAGLGAFVAALAGAVITTGTLSLRQELHRFASAIDDQDLFATVQFAAIAIIVLPLVPDQTYGPWGVWNPRTIWILVVLISGVSFVGYVAAKLVGTRRGIGLSGVLGGLASSTAVTLSFSHQSRRDDGLSRLLAVGVLSASAIMVPRVLVILSVVAPSVIVPLLVPYSALFLVTVAGAVVAYRFGAAPQIKETPLANPFRLRAALQFGLLFALVLLVARAAREFLGDSGVYLASALAGVTQLDAITLTLGRQLEGGLELSVAVRGLALAAASNSLFKGVLALTTGAKRFGRTVFVTLLVAAAACVASAWWLPLLRPAALAELFA
ncbi:MAG: MgtC/SapB family protein [Trueperaceae bacterium]|nr:MgtC/SapB family protein [Trueperaceae bacterium]